MEDTFHITFKQTFTICSRNYAHLPFGMFGCHTPMFCVFLRNSEDHRESENDSGKDESISE